MRGDASGTRGSAPKAHDVCYVSVQGWLSLALQHCPQDQRNVTIDLVGKPDGTTGQPHTLESLLASGSSLPLDAPSGQLAAAPRPTPPPPLPPVPVWVPSPIAAWAVDFGAAVPALWGVVAEQDSKADSIRLGEILGTGVFGQVRCATTADGSREKSTRPEHACATLSGTSFDGVGGHRQ